MPCHRVLVQTDHDSTIDCTLDGKTVEELIDMLKNYEQSLDERERDCERLRDCYEKNIRGKNPTDEQLNFYSDWHKDLYGRSPRTPRSTTAFPRHLEDRPRRTGFRNSQRPNRRRQARVR